MKRVLKLFAVLAILVVSVVSFTGCASTYKKITYDVSTGDQIEIKLNSSNGYNITSEVPFKVSKDDEVICQGSFFTEDTYDQYVDLIDAMPGVTIIEKKSANGVDYVFYELVEAGQDTEYDYIMKVKDSKTTVVMGSTKSKAAAQECFKRMKFSVKK